MLARPLHVSIHVGSMVPHDMMDMLYVVRRECGACPWYMGNRSLTIRMCVPLATHLCRSMGNNMNVKQLRDALANMPEHAVIVLSVNVADNDGYTGTDDELYVYAGHESFNTVDYVVITDDDEMYRCHR